MAAKQVAAWKCIQAAPYYKAMNTAEQDNTQCAVGETFFGELSNTESGSFICNQSNGLYVQTSACQELTWICVASGGVMCRHSAEMSDKAESQVLHGNRISALPVPDKPGWLQEAASKKYVPMNHPSTGEPLFTKVDTANPTQAVPMATVMGAQQVGGAVMLTPPPTVPPGSNLILEKYNGTNTLILGCLAGWICFPCGCVVCCMQLDERQCWLAPDGRKFDLAGARIVE